MKYDVIVIGAGIIGCCTAYELAKRGKRTLNIDKLPASGYGSTSGCGETIWTTSCRTFTAGSWSGAACRGRGFGVAPWVRSSATCNGCARA